MKNQENFNHNNIKKQLTCKFKHPNSNKKVAKDLSKNIKITKAITKTLLFATFFILLFSSTSFCATAKIVSKLENALKTISKWIVKLSTPVAAVALGSGLLIKKFSFGDEERISMGKKIIRNSIFSYAFILVIDLVLDAIKSIMT